MKKLLKMGIILATVMLSGCGVYDSDLKTAQAYCMDTTGSYLLSTVYDSGILGERRFGCYKGGDKIHHYSVARAYLINKELDKGGKDE